MDIAEFFWLSLMHYVKANGVQLGTLLLVTIPECQYPRGLYKPCDGLTSGGLTLGPCSGSLSMALDVWLAAHLQTGVLHY